MKNKIILIILFAICLTTNLKAQVKSVNERVKGRNYPSAFMAWYNIDMPSYPLDSEENRLRACAKHDLMWEEPLSQLGEKVDLVLGLVWDHQYHGLATQFTRASLEKARLNKKRLLEINPNMVCLFEIRWRDAPMSFLPDDSKWWKRTPDGEIVKGWLGGWQPFYMLDYTNKAFIENIARQAKIAMETGIYEGIMLDWSGDLEVIKAIRQSVGDQSLIIVNIHDDIEDAMKYKEYINGSFMELNPIDTLSLPVEELKIINKDDVNKRSWKKIELALEYFESNFREPRINCLEVWGNRSDLSRMRATTTLGLTMSDGYVLYADPNPLATPDHFHDWYPFWDTSLGKPIGKGEKQKDGSHIRHFDGGTVVYNPYGNATVNVRFKSSMKRISDGSIGREFQINQRDGDIFVKHKK